MIPNAKPNKDNSSPSTLDPLKKSHRGSTRYITCNSAILTTQVIQSTPPIEIPQPQSPSSSPLTKISSTRNDDWFNTTNNAEFSMLEIPIIEEKGDAEIIVVDCSNEETPHRKNFTSGVKNKTELEQQDTFSFSTSSKSFDSSSQSSKKNCG